MAAVLLAFAGAQGGPRPIALRRASLDLPGPPAAIVSADLDHDGRRDLLVVAAYSKWGSISADRVDNAIAVTEVVPALFELREARAFLARADGTYHTVPPLSLPAGVLAVQAGPTEHPVLALTEDGVSELRWSGTSAGESLDLVPLFAEPSAFAGSRSFLPDFPFLIDVDGDGVLDAVIPGASGLAIHRGGKDGELAAAATYNAPLPGDERYAFGDRAVRRIPNPVFEDVDGDGVPDLVIDQLRDGVARVGIAKGLGGARFGAPSWVNLGCLYASSSSPGGTSKDREVGPRFPRVRIAWFGDLDHDGHAEIVTLESIDTGKSDMKETKRPTSRYRVFRLAPDLTIDPKPLQTFDAEGYAFSGAIGDGPDVQFIDLDHDGRKDLITLTLDFSMFQALRAITAKKVSIGLEFHVYAQQPDGSFRLVPDQTLDEKLHLDLNHLEISRLGQFQGDFDGDGRIDFVHLGKGKSITIHRGEAGAKYPDKPDLAIALDDEPEDVLLVRVRDLDGDGRSDIAITRTHSGTESGATAPVTLELYLSKGAP